MGCLVANDSSVLLWLGVRTCAWCSHSQGKVGGWVNTTAATTGGVQCHYFADWDRSIKRDKWKERRKKVRGKGALDSWLLLWFWVIYQPFDNGKVMFDWPRWHGTQPRGEEKRKKMRKLKEKSKQRQKKKVSLFVCVLKRKACPWCVRSLGLIMYFEPRIMYKDYIERTRSKIQKQASSSFILSISLH